MLDSSQLEFDIVIAGGGTSGCVVASRLAAADPSLSILVLEAGPPTREDLAHIQPARFLTHLQANSTTVKFNVGKESEDLGGRAPVVPCGQCLGGGSSVNFTMYNRPSASDFDDWENVHGNPGWGSHDIIPLLQKMETYQAQPGLETHGYSGPLKISYGGLSTQSGEEFLGVAARYDNTRPYIDDPNGLFEVNAYGKWQKFIDVETGRRSDVPHNYIYNQNFENLTILTGHLVKRILFENATAVGVEYMPDCRFHGKAEDVVHVARAKRLVVVSAGAFGSPALLERSGIGSETLVRSLGITPTVDLPGVGENYQDHIVIFTPYYADDSVETLDGILQSKQDELSKWTTQWNQNGTGLMATNGIDAGVKLRPSDEELKDIGPGFQQRWKAYFANAPDKPILWTGIGALFVGDFTAAPARKCFSTPYFVTYPCSVGYVHITSADNTATPADFDPRYLSCPEDLLLMRWGYKFSRELARRLPSYRGEHLASHPIFPPGSKAICHADARPVDISEVDIAYTTEDDEAIDIYIRKTVATAWHSLGTCTMRPREKGGVVDSCLNVYGVQGLKVADMSIASANVSSNTYATALAIGEKAAVIITEELGLI